MTEPDLFIADDQALAEADQDRFHRDRLVERIAAEARTASPEGGFVIGLSGPWGSGKTTVANFAIGELERTGSLVVRFNPWMFSGAEDLVARFFGDLAKVLGRRDRKLREVARRVAGYASALAAPANVLPIFGPGVAVALTAGGQLAGMGSPPTLDDEYQGLARALGRLRRRIVIFLDDLDRLADDDIREIVRLVKAVGDLPNLTYVLAFDREHVEFVLGGAGEAKQARERGRRYLEKIVQVRHDVPQPGEQDLLNFFVEQLNGVLNRHGVEGFGPIPADGVLRAISRMLRTPRDVKRAANSFAAGLDLHGDEVAIVDLIGLEALRTFEPDIHASLPRLAEILMGYSPGISADDEKVADERKRRMDQLLETARHPEGARELLQQLFPAAHAALDDGRHDWDWGTEDFANRRHLWNTGTEDFLNRVTVPRVFRRYTHAILTRAEVSTEALGRVAGLTATDPAQFEQALAEFRGDQLVDLLTRLPAALPPLDNEQVRAAAAALLRATAGSENGSEPIRSRQTNQDFRVMQLIRRMLETEPDLGRRRGLVRGLFDAAPDLTSRWRLIGSFGTYPWRARRPKRSEWLGEEMSADLAKRLAAEVLDADADALADEVESGPLLLAAQHLDAEAARDSFAAKASSDRFVLTLLRYLAGSVRSDSGEYWFDWKTYAELLGEDVAKERALALAASADSSALDSTTLSALRDAAAIARGEMPPVPHPFREDDDQDEDGGERPDAKR